MVNPLHNNGRAALKEDKKQVAPFADLLPKPDIRSELLLRLSSKLQSTLEVQTLLGIFFNEIKSAVLVNGMTYSNSNQNLMFHHGKESVHSCSYHLTTHKGYMSELSFSRNTRFHKANIEGLISTLVFPLRNALRYHEAIAAALHDPLTGSDNRVALDKTLEREVELAKRHNQPLSVLMLDIDHFKYVNAVTASIRQADMCFRYGGEEFLILLGNTDAARIKQKTAVQPRHHRPGSSHAG